MTFDPSIGYGSIITIGMLLVGLVGGWYTLKTEFKDRSRRQDVAETKHEELDAAFQAHKLHISENYVKRNDLREIEDRIGKMLDRAVDPINARVKEVDHKLNGLTAKLDERVMSLLSFRKGE